MGSLLLMVTLLANTAPRPVVVTVSPAEVIQGQLLLIEIAGTEPGDEVTGSFGKHTLRFFRTARGQARALTAVSLKHKPGPVALQVQVTLPGQDPIVHGRPVTVRAGHFEKQTLRVDSKFVRPPKKFRRQIRQERRALSRLWKAPATERQWRGSFIWPRRDKICSTFGLKRMFNKQLRSRHYGLDIDGKNGDPIVAMGAGRVVMVAERYYSGGTIVIDHGLKLFSLYFHLSAFEVKVGDRVERGHRIGLMGESGRATGPHLHLSNRVENISFDPLGLLNMDLTENQKEGTP